MKGISDDTNCSGFSGWRINSPPANAYPYNKPTHPKKPSDRCPNLTPRPYSPSNPFYPPRPFQ